MNVIDVLAILPYYVELAMAQSAHNDQTKLLNEPAFMLYNSTNIDEDITKELDDESLQGLLQVFRVFKLARILKLARSAFKSLNWLVSTVFFTDILVVFSPSSSH